MGSSSDGTQTITQTTEPPADLRPYLQEGIQGAQDVYNQGPHQFYSGNTVVPFSSQTQQALDMTQQRAMAGSPVMRSANTYANDVLSGNYLGSNPYLDRTFNRAADNVQQRLSSQFAGSGRNLDASRNPQSQELNDLATGIYGGDYQAERSRMQQMVPQAGLLAEQDYADAERLAGVGARYEDLNSRQIQDQVARHEYAQNAPGAAVDDYLGRLAQYPGSSSTSRTPMFGNDFASALGGAMGIAELGSAFGIDWGSLGSSLLGGTSGGASGGATGGTAADAPSGFNTSGGGMAGGVAGGIGAGLLGGGGAATPGGAVTITGAGGEILGGGAVAGSGGTAAGGTAAGTAGGTAGTATAGGIGSSSAGFGAAAGTAALIAAPAVMGMLDIFGNEPTGHAIADFAAANNIPLYRTTGGYRGAGQGIQATYGQLPDGRWMNSMTMERLTRMTTAEEINQFLATFRGDGQPRGTYQPFNPGGSRNQLQGP